MRVMKNVRSRLYIEYNELLIEAMFLRSSFTEQLTHDLWVHSVAPGTLFYFLGLKLHRAK